jgi:hypothetical protein
MTSHRGLNRQKTLTSMGVDSAGDLLVWLTGEADVLADRKIGFLIILQIYGNRDQKHRALQMNIYSYICSIYIGEADPSHLCKPNMEQKGNKGKSKCAMLICFASLVRQALSAF